MIIRDVTIGEAEQAIIRTTLLEVVNDGNAAGVFLIGGDGFVVMREGKLAIPDPVGLATLVAAAFAAARETARLAGIADFDAAYWHGGESGVYVRTAGQEHLLLAIHDETATFGLMKLVVEKAAIELEQLLTGKMIEIEAGDDPQKGRWKDIAAAMRKPETDESDDPFSGLSEEPQ
ncbi:MAG: roadblock/LC7 domain-containing protein [bacterium]|nr:roadblock/LC7 domain-containing protein [bacterium]